MNERAHAAALEENARLKAELGRFSDRNGYALRQRANRAEAELAKLKDEQARAAKIFADALMQWGVEKTELQAELAKLRQHAAGGFTLGASSGTGGCPPSNRAYAVVTRPHAEAADILHPPQDEQARADFPEEK